MPESSSTSRAKATKILATRLIQGYRPQQEKCSTCNTPLMEFKGGVSCVVCSINLIDVSSNQTHLKHQQQSSEIIKHTIDARDDASTSISTSHPSHNATNKATILDSSSAQYPQSSMTNESVEVALENKNSKAIMQHFSSMNCDRNNRKNDRFFAAVLELSEKLKMKKAEANMEEESERDEAVEERKNQLQLEWQRQHHSEEEHSHPSTVEDTEVVKNSSCGQIHTLKHELCDPLMGSQELPITKDSMDSILRESSLNIQTTAYHPEAHHSVDSLRTYPKSQQFGHSISRFQHSSNSPICHKKTSINTFLRKDLTQTMVTSPRDKKVRRYCWGEEKAVNSIDEDVGCDTSHPEDMQVKSIEIQSSSRKNDVNDVRFFEELKFKAAFSKANKAKIEVDMEKILLNEQAKKIYENAVTYDDTTTLHSKSSKQSIQNTSVQAKNIELVQVSHVDVELGSDNNDVAEQVMIDLSDITPCIRPTEIQRRNQHDEIVFLPDDEKKAIALECMQEFKPPLPFDEIFPEAVECKSNANTACTFDNDVESTSFNDGYSNALPDGKSEYCISTLNAANVESSTQYIHRGANKVVNTNQDLEVNEREKDESDGVNEGEIQVMNEKMPDEKSENYGSIKSSVIVKSSTESMDSCSTIKEINKNKEFDGKRREKKENVRRNEESKEENERDRKEIEREKPDEKPEDCTSIMSSTIFETSIASIGSGGTSTEIEKNKKDIYVKMINNEVNKRQNENTEGVSERDKKTNEKIKSLDIIESSIKSIDDSTKNDIEYNKKEIEMREKEDEENSRVNMKKREMKVNNEQTEEIDPANHSVSVVQGKAPKNGEVRVSRVEKNEYLIEEILDVATVTAVTAKDQFIGSHEIKEICVPFSSSSESLKEASSSSKTENQARRLAHLEKEAIRKHKEAEIAAINARIALDNMIEVRNTVRNTSDDFRTDLSMCSSISEKSCRFVVDSNHHMKPFSKAEKEVTHDNPIVAGVHRSYSEASSSQYKHSYDCSNTMNSIEETLPSYSSRSYYSKITPHKNNFEVENHSEKHIRSTAKSDISSCYMTQLSQSNALDINKIGKFHSIKQNHGEKCIAQTSKASLIRGSSSLDQNVDNIHCSPSTSPIATNATLVEGKKASFQLPALTSAYTDLRPNKQTVHSFKRSQSASPRHFSSRLSGRDSYPQIAQSLTLSSMKNSAGNDLVPYSNVISPEMRPPTIPGQEWVSHSSNGRNNASILEGDFLFEARSALVNVQKTYIQHSKQGSSEMILPTQTGNLPYPNYFNRRTNFPQERLETGMTTSNLDKRYDDIKYFASYHGLFVKSFTPTSTYEQHRFTFRDDSVDPIQKIECTSLSQLCKGKGGIGSSHGPRPDFTPINTTIDNTTKLMRYSNESENYSVDPLQNIKSTSISQQSDGKDNEGAFQGPTLDLSPTSNTIGNMHKMRRYNSESETGCVVSQSMQYVLPNRVRFAD